MTAELLNTYDIVALARKHVAANPSMESSARLCLADAVDCYNHGEYVQATQRALKSLTYSVGIFHPDCAKAHRDALIATVNTSGE